MTVNALELKEGQEQSTHPPEKNHQEKVKKSSTTNHEEPVMTNVTTDISIEKKIEKTDSGCSKKKSESENSKEKGKEQKTCDKASVKNKVSSSDASEAKVPFKGEGRQKTEQKISLDALELKEGQKQTSHPPEKNQVKPNKSRNNSRDRCPNTTDKKASETSKNKEESSNRPGHVSSEKHRDEDSLVRTVSNPVVKDVNTSHNISSAKERAKKPQEVNANSVKCVEKKDAKKKSDSNFKEKRKEEFLERDKSKCDEKSLHTVVANENDLSTSAEIVTSGVERTVTGEKETPPNFSDSQRLFLHRSMESAICSISNPDPCSKNVKLGAKLSDWKRQKTEMLRKKTAVESLGVRLQPCSSKPKQDPSVSFLESADSSTVELGSFDMKQNAVHELDLYRLRSRVCSLVRTMFPSMRYPGSFNPATASVDAMVDSLICIASKKTEEIAENSEV